MNLSIDAPMRGHVSELRVLDLRTPKKRDLTETRHLFSTLGCQEFHTRNHAKDVLPLIETKNTPHTWKKNERTTERGTK